MLWTDPINISKSVPDNRYLLQHQQNAVDALNKYFKIDSKTAKQNGMLVMPTGSGKTFTAVNWLMNSYVAQGYKVVWFVHRQELINQSYNEFRNQAPRLSKYGIDKIRIAPISGIHLKMSMASRCEINICSIASVANDYGYRFIKRMLGKQGQEKLVVVIDEAHHAITPSYQKVLKRITALNPNRILLGLTATPTRMQERDIRRLYRQFDVFDNINIKRGNSKGFIYEVTMKELLIEGFLAKPVYYKIETKINGDKEYVLSEEDENYFNKFGEFSEEMKTKIAGSAARNKIILDEYLKNKARYGKTLIFAINQEHARALSYAFNEAGISCDYVVSDKPNTQQTIAEFKQNKFMVLINVQILTEGSDVPDIQTIFLTRQTNSDSLLMQMIGRGMRGPAVGGTNIVNIIDFHDTWDKFSFWIDPQKLLVFDDEQIESQIVSEIPEKSKDMILSDEMSPLDIPEILGQEASITEWDLYLRVYNNMKSNLLSGIPVAVFPNGWFSVVDLDGNDKRILVYDSQVPGYKNIEKIFDKIYKDKISVNKLIADCFNIKENLPDYNDIALIINYINENGQMPDFFTFEQRELVDTKKIALEMNKRFTKDKEKEMWLKELFDNSPLIREFFKLFFVFKKSVFTALEKKQESIVETIDERDEYHLVDNAYNLEELLDEIITTYSNMNKQDLISIKWSDNCIRQWFGLCQKWVDNFGHPTYAIQINKILSSPDVDRDLIKYLIYHEMLHKSGFWDHDMKFRELEWAYPNSDEHDGFLDELAMRYNLDIIWDKPKRISNDRKPVLNTSSIITTSSQETDMLVKRKFCRNCGNELPVEANFCDKCGSKTDYQT